MSTSGSSIADDELPDSSDQLAADHIENGGGIGVFDLAIALAKHKKLILALPLAAGILAAVYSLTLSNTYTASAKILPPQQSQSTATAMLAQLGTLGLGGVSGAKSPSELYVSMLKSRTVADSMIRRFDLHSLWKQKFLSDTRAAFAGRTVISVGKDGIITIEVDDQDPKRAAELANGYVDELRRLTNVLALTEASQRRLFFEQQLTQARSQLAKAEASARQALDRGGLAQVEGQARALLESTGRLRGQITVKEVQIGAMRTFAAESNPELHLAQQELEAMKRELAKIEGTGTPRVGGTTSGSTGMDNVRLLRDLRYYETVNELLAKQYEIARIDEAKDAALIQVLDGAIEPDHKSKPKRTVIVLLSGLAALLAAILWALVSEAMARARADPQHTQRLQAFRRYLAWR